MSAKIPKRMGAINQNQELCSCNSKVLDRANPDLAGIAQNLGHLQAVGTSVNQIITLTSSTGFHAQAKKPPAGYPETYFGRMPLPQEAVMAVIAACRSDDIYHQVGLATVLNTLLTHEKLAL